MISGDGARGSGAGQEQVHDAPAGAAVQRVPRTDEEDHDVQSVGPVPRAAFTICWTEVPT